MAKYRITYHAPYTFANFECDASSLEEGRALKEQHNLEKGYMISNREVKSETFKLIQKDVKTELQALGITFRRTDFGDFRVAYSPRPGFDNEPSSSYTDDLQDAFDTGKAMAKRGHPMDDKQHD